MSVNHCARSGGIIQVGIYFRFFSHEGILCVESPHGSDSNVYIQYTIFIIKKKIIPDYSKSAAMGFFPYGLQNEFETAVVNEPPVFEPLKFYCL